MARMGKRRGAYRVLVGGGERRARDKLIDLT